MTAPSAQPEEEAALRSEVVREGLTMALYISLSQLAVLVSVPRSMVDGDENLWWQILMTSIGLVIAHQVAFRMSARLLADGSRLDPATPRIQRAQVVGGGAVTLLAAVPVLILGPSFLWLSIGLLLAFVMAVGYRVARTAPSSRPRSLMYVIWVAVVVVGVLAVKTAVGH